MNLGDIATWELNDGCAPPIGRIAWNENCDPGRGRLRESVGKIRDFISGDLPSVGIRYVAIGHKQCKLSKTRRDADSATGLGRPSDLHARRMEVFLEHRPKDAFGRHRYDPSDFGWSYAGLAEEFSGYTERYHVRSELAADR